ncbi:MAG: hypothetical protein Q9196_002375, partial [Gyalolechia fulgens]
NVDYNDLKRLIKVRTTRGQGEALTIPGHQNEARSLQAFENEFFTELVDQHQRVDLFVQSKAGEINRRLVHLDKQVGQLKQRFPSYHTQKVSVRCLERFAKAEEAAEKAGEEIRSLARFVGAQKLAFVKLLKKYKKWTSSEALETRFRAKVLNKPTAFSKRDLQPLLAQYTNVLAAVRAPFERDGNGKNQPRSDGYQPGIANGTASRSRRTSGQRTNQSVHANKEPQQSTAAKIHTTCQSSSDVDFDSALAVWPLGRLGGKASYWVHPDNLVELHVLLLQYTRLRRTTNPDAADLAANESRRQSPRISTNGNGDCHRSGGDQGMGLVICDDLQRFASGQSSAPISDTEESAGGVPEKAAATVRYSSDGKALLAVNMSSSDNKATRTSGPFRTLRIKWKIVRHLFNSGQSSSASDRFTREQDPGDDENLISVQNWLKSHQEIQPLVELQCKRTRFVGLKNDESSGTWATLDRDIIMKETPRGFFSTKEADLSLDDSEARGFVHFPFAVLEIRNEGDSGTDLLAALDETHLTERIRGFSMETHAVATLCKPPGLPPPYWLPALDQDLRKIPATVKTATSRQQNHQLSPSGSMGKTSTSATSVGDYRRSSHSSVPTIESQATSAPNFSEPSPVKAVRKKRRLCKDRLVREQAANSRQPSHQHYWNEYDDGEENTDNEPFVILVDPNKSTSFSGFPTFHSAVSSMASRAKASSKKVQSWLGTSGQASRNNAAPAGDENSSDFRDVATPDDDSDLDDSPTDPLLYHHHNNRQYFTFRGRRESDYAYGARESLLSRCCAAFFAASFALLVVAALLVSAGRRKAIVKVDVGVITGVVFSLVFAVSGVGCMLKRRENVGIIQRAFVFLALIVVCVGSGVLLAGVNRK